MTGQGEFTLLFSPEDWGNNTHKQVNGTDMPKMGESGGWGCEMIGALERAQSRKHYRLSVNKAQYTLRQRMFIISTYKQKKRTTK